MSRPRYFETADARPLPGIAARHPSYCGRCDVLIVPGERIVFARGRAVHVGCASGQEER